MAAVTFLVSLIIIVMAMTNAFDWNKGLARMLQVVSQLFGLFCIPGSTNLHCSRGLHRHCVFLHWLPWYGFRHLRRRLPHQLSTPDNAFSLVWSTHFVRAWRFWAAGWQYFKSIGHGLVSSCSLSWTWNSVKDFLLYICNTIFLLFQNIFSRMTICGRLLIWTIFSSASTKIVFSLFLHCWSR